MLSSILQENFGWPPETVFMFLIPTLCVSAFSGHIMIILSVVWRKILMEESGEEPCLRVLHMYAQTIWISAIIPKSSPEAVSRHVILSKMQRDVSGWEAIRADCFALIHRKIAKVVYANISQEGILLV